MKVEKQIKNNSSRVIQSPGKRVIMRLVDNRVNCNVLAKNNFIAPLAIQRAALITSPGNSHPQDIHRQRSLNYKRNETDKCISVKAYPHFYVNIGGVKIKGGETIYGCNEDGHSHAESVLLSKLYGASNSNWETVNSQLNGKRDHFKLFTERSPCPECCENLNKDCYTNEDIVFSSIQLTTNSKENASKIASFYFEDTKKEAKYGLYEEEELRDFSFNGSYFCGKLHKKPSRKNKRIVK